jgi:uncharacterized protein (UPF0303 family)
MTPKEKAKELVSKYITNQDSWYLENLVDGLRVAQAKQCALIAVDLRLDGYFIFNSIEYGIDSLEYWQQVKQEIQAL